MAALLLSTLDQAHAVEAIVTDAPILFADRVLIGTDGEPVRFRGDIIGAGPTVISFTFTGCQSICPVADIVMTDVEQSIAGSNQVRLVTITLDPLTDSPQRLARHASAIGSVGRQWLTGEPHAVFDVLEGLGMQFGSLDEHASFFVVVNGAGTDATRVPEVTSGAQEILEALGALD
jgi:protein SCO1/2